MKIDVAYAINEAYVDYCLVSMLSVITNNPQSRISFHILTDGLSTSAKSRLRQTHKQHIDDVFIYEIDESKINNLELAKFNRNIWLRIFLPELVDENIQRILYLDTDTIVCGDISELFSMDLTGCSLAGCMDYMGFSDDVYKRVGYPRKYGYNCSGVMVMNLDYFRENNLTKKILDYARSHAETLKFPDQDAINCVCHETMKLLPLKYDILSPFLSDADFIAQHKSEVKEILTDPKIIHYAGCNPWRKESRTKHYYESEFWNYAKQIGDIRREWSKSGVELLKRIIMMVLGQLGVSRYRQFRFYQPMNPKAKTLLQEIMSQQEHNFAEIL